MTAITELPDASSIGGDEYLELSQPSTTVRITATTISAQASDNSYNDSGSGFVTAGFAVGNRVNVTDFTGNTANNIRVAEITALTAGKMSIGGSEGDAIVDEAAGDNVTIAKWETRKALASDVGGGGGGGSGTAKGFRASMSSNQTYATNEFSVVEFDTVGFDTESAFDTVQHRWTVPAALDGAMMNVGAGVRITSDFLEFVAYVTHKDSTDAVLNQSQISVDNGQMTALSLGAVQVSTDDYFEIAVFAKGNSLTVDSSVKPTHFWGYVISG